MAVAIGRMNGSASRATNRSTMCSASASTPTPPASFTTARSILTRAPSCTSTIAPAETARESSSRPSSMFRRRGDDRMPEARWASGRGRVVVASATGVVLRVAHDGVRGVAGRGGDGLRDLGPRERAELRPGHVRDRDDVAQRDGAERGLDALVDRDPVAVEPDVVARLRVAVAEHRGTDHRAEQERARREPGAPALPEPPPVLLDQGVEVVLRLRLEARL